MTTSARAISITATAIISTAATAKVVFIFGTLTQNRTEAFDFGDQRASTTLQERSYRQLTDPICFIPQI